VTNPTLQQTITINPAGGALSESALNQDGSFATWLTFTNSGNVVTVTANPVTVAPGTYQASILIAQAGGGSVNVPVSLIVSTQPVVTLSVSPTTLNFSYQIGGASPASQSVTPNSPTQGLSYSASASSTGNWLSVSAPNPVTPNPATVSVDPSGLAVGTYTGTITFNGAGAANNPQSVTVTLTVTNNPALSATPNPVVFNYEIGQAIPPVQTVTVTSGGTPIAFTATGNATWFYIIAGNPVTTPGTVVVGITPNGLAPGTYSGSILLSSPGATVQTSVPVTLNVSTVALLNLPTSISFSSPAGAQPGQVGQSQVISVTSTGEAVGYSVGAVALTPAGTTWLSVGSPSGPASSTGSSGFVVVVNPSGLAAGVYSGNVLVHPSNGTPDITIPVTYTITSNGVTVSPNSLSFTQVVNGPAPAWQNLNIGATGASPTFSVSVSTSAQVNWLSVTPSGGTAPAVLTVAANAGSLPAGTYTGTITVSSPGNPSQVIPVTLTVTSS
jgi:hypothetical protein